MSYEQLCVADRVVPLESLTHVFSEYENTRIVEINDMQGIPLDHFQILLHSVGSTLRLEKMRFGSIS